MYSLYRGKCVNGDYQVQYKAWYKALRYTFLVPARAELKFLRVTNSFHRSAAMVWPTVSGQIDGRKGQPGE